MQFRRSAQEKALERRTRFERALHSRTCPSEKRSNWPSRKLVKFFRSILNNTELKSSEEVRMEPHI